MLPVGGFWVFAFIYFHHTFCTVILTISPIRCHLYCCTRVIGGHIPSCLVLSKCLGNWKNKTRMVSIEPWFQIYSYLTILICNWAVSTGTQIQIYFIRQFRLPYTNLWENSIGETELSWIYLNSNPYAVSLICIHTNVYLNLCITTIPLYYQNWYWYSLLKLNQKVIF